MSVRDLIVIAFSSAAIDPKSTFKRKATKMQLEDHSRAMERFAGQKFNLDDDDDDDDDDDIGKILYTGCIINIVVLCTFKCICIGSKCIITVLVINSLVILVLDNEHSHKLDFNWYLAIEDQLTKLNDLKLAIFMCET